MEKVPHKAGVEWEADYCADLMFQEITGGKLRPEAWYVWYLCERHGGPPLLDPSLPPAQIACWDGEDILIAVHASLFEIIAALPEELAHRLSSRETARFEFLNYTLQHALSIPRADFQEMVGQRVAARFAAHHNLPRSKPEIIGNCSNLIQQETQKSANSSGGMDAHGTLAV